MKFYHLLRILNYIIQFLFIRIEHIRCIDQKSYYTLRLGMIPFTGMYLFGRPQKFIYDHYKHYDFFDWIGIRKFNKIYYPPVDILLKYTE